MSDFSLEAKKIIDEGAQAEASRLNSDILEPEHIMLAMMADEETGAAHILHSLVINFDRLRIEIESFVRRSSRTALVASKLFRSSRFQRVLDLSIEEADRLGNSETGTEHLLLAVFTEGSCAGLETLSRAGIDYNTVKQKIIRIAEQKIRRRNIEEELARSRNADRNPRPKQGKKNLEEFVTDFTKLAEEGNLDPVIGREQETDRVIRILCRKRKNNPVLIGEAGVGKTSIVEGLAIKISEGKVPDPINGMRVLAMDMSSIVAGTKYRGEFEERFKNLMDDIRERKNIILFIDELHTLIGAGSAEGAIDAANILKPALARGELRCIGATTTEEYRRHIEKDAALVRRFQSILVKEPTPEQTLAILKGLQESYENHHHVKYSPEALEKAVLFSRRYINDRFLPDKAIDLIDEAGARACLMNYEKPDDIIKLEKAIDVLNEKKLQFVRQQKYEKAAVLRDQIIGKKNLLQSKTEDWHSGRNGYGTVISADDIAAVISESTGILLSGIKESESEKLINMEKVLGEKIIGQNEAVSVLSRTIRRSRAGLSDDSKPLGSFMFLGPTGVGKTWMAEVLAGFLFNDPASLIRIDMTEYMEKYSVSRLLGAPPGYVGYEEGGQLTEKVRRRPYSLVLFDEIEKAHPDALNILLQILDEGSLTDSNGVNVSFKDTVIVMTSNAGARDYQKISRMGFSEDSGQEKTDNSRAREEVRRLFSPEFLNRIDEIIYFNRLSKKDAEQITQLFLDRISASLMKKKKLSLNFTPEVKSFITEKGFSDLYGARNLRRTAVRELEDPLAEEIIRGAFGKNTAVLASVDEGKIVFRPVKQGRKMNQERGSETVILNKKNMAGKEEKIHSVKK